MEYKKAITVLINLLDKKLLDAEERGAVLAAIGALDCASLADKRMEGIIKAKKTKQDRSLGGLY
jgi:hypothetical protein